MGRPVSFPFLVCVSGGVIYLASCQGDLQTSAPPANRQPSVTTTFSTGDTTTFDTSSGTYDTTGLGGWGGDFGTGGSDDDGSAGSGGDRGDADRCAVGATTEYFLSDLSWIGTPTNGFGPVERDTSNGEMAAGDGRPMSIAGMPFAKGLGVHANSSVEFGLAGKCTTFSAYVGADDEANSASITFEVWVDGQRMYSSPQLVRSGQAAELVEVDVTCASSLRLVVTDGVVDGNTRDHADWGDAKVTCVTKPGGSYVDAASDRSQGSGGAGGRDASDASRVDASSVDAAQDASTGAGGAGGAGGSGGQRTDGGFGGGFGGRRAR
jgi:hypothetical protein